MLCIKTVCVFTYKLKRKLYRSQQRYWEFVLPLARLDRLDLRGLYAAQEQESLIKRRAGTRRIDCPVHPLRSNFLQLMALWLVHRTSCLDQHCKHSSHFHMTVAVVVVSAAVRFRKRFFPWHVFVGQTILLTEYLSFDFPFLQTGHFNLDSLVLTETYAC